MPVPYLHISFLLAWISVQILTATAWTSLSSSLSKVLIGGRSRTFSAGYPGHCLPKTSFHASCSSRLFSLCMSFEDHAADIASSPWLSVDQALNSRYACTRFQRFDGVTNTTTSPSLTINSTVLKLATQALHEARRAPSGFNAQPYKLLLVSNATQKEALSRWCCGHNAHRVRDSDCTVVFLADRQWMWELSSYRRTILFGKEGSNTNKKSWTTFGLYKIQLLVSLFSQGFPLPYWLSAPMGWMVRLGMRMVSWMTRHSLPIPTLSNPDTWAQKNTMLVAMAYMLGCTARGLQTSPMEGYCAWGIKQALKIPRRYSIPLIVATGSPYQRPTKSSDDAGMTHGPKSMTVRYPEDTILFQNTFGVVRCHE